MDYQQLNSIHNKDSYPLPSIDGALCVIGDTNYFLAMDLTTDTIKFFSRKSIKKSEC